MVVCVSQLIMLAHAGRLSRMPSLVTLEGVMKLSAMVVQMMQKGSSVFFFESSQLLERADLMTFAGKVLEILVCNVR